MLFALSDSVLLGAIGGTTLNVIGIFIIVARYLFPQRSRKIIPITMQFPLLFKRLMLLRRRVQHPTQDFVFALLIFGLRLCHG